MASEKKTTEKNKEKNYKQKTELLGRNALVRPNSMTAYWRIDQTSRD